MWLIYSLLITDCLYAAVKVGFNTVISEPTTYSHVLLDMTTGNFIIRNNASLIITDSTIIGTLSATKPTLIYVESGSLTLSNNRVNITASMLGQHPDTQSLAYMVRLNDATLNMTGNSFAMTEPFTAGLLITNMNKATNHIYIAKNKVTDFHGVFYLLNTTNAVVENNLLKKNSYGNIVIMGSDSEINNNSILYSGRDRIGDGDAIDVIDSDNVKITNNVISTPGCYGIWVMSSQSVLIDNNTITGGVTYAMTISNPAFKDINKDAVKLLTELGKKVLTHSLSSNITITNNILHQNRYGITAIDVNHLTITDNFFSQKFKDTATRQFWTDNKTLMKNVTELVWENNMYKEAFTQENRGDNSKIQFVTFPAIGGVVLLME